VNICTKTNVKLVKFNLNDSTDEKEMCVLSVCLCMPTVNVHCNTIQLDLAQLGFVMPGASNKQGLPLKK
jgi:hypothetical protein